MSQRINIQLPVFISSNVEKFFDDLFKKYPSGYVYDAIIGYLMKHTKELRWTYEIEDLTDDDKSWFINFIEGAIEAEYEAEMAAAEAEAEAQAIAEAEAAMFEQMMMEEEYGFDGPRY